MYCETDIHVTVWFPGQQRSHLQADKTFLYLQPLLLTAQLLRWYVPSNVFSLSKFLLLYW